MGIDKVSIVKTWMFVIMNHSSNKIAKHFMITHLAQIPEATRVDIGEKGLCQVSRMRLIVIGNIVVSALNSLQKVEKSVFVNVQS